VGLLRRWSIALICALAGLGLGEIALVISRIVLPDPVIGLRVRVGGLLVVLAGLLVWRAWDRRRTRDDLGFMRGTAKDRLYENRSLKIGIDGSDARQADARAAAAGEAAAA
jgi:hypothetical protein